jgi:hypothetical protein
MIIHVLHVLKISDPQLLLSTILQMLQFHALHYRVFYYSNLNNLIEVFKRLYQTKKYCLENIDQSGPELTIVSLKWTSHDYCR